MYIGFLHGRIVFIQESGRETDPENYVSDGAESCDVRLAEMLEMGMEVIGDEKPFFIMCEGGNIDWAAHANKTMSMVMDILEFEEAIEVALEFYKKHPDETLIVVTADHETGGVALGYGPDWDHNKPQWQVVENAWLEAGQSNTLSEEENSKLNAEGRIGWTTTYHTGAEVPVYAIGKGAEKFCGRIDNTDIKGKILCE